MGNRAVINVDLGGCFGLGCLASDDIEPVFVVVHGSNYWSSTRGGATAS